MHRTRTTIVVAVLAALALCAPASANYRVGLSEQNAAVFSQPAWQQLKLKRVRYILGSARPESPGPLKVLTLLLATLAVAVTPLVAGAVSDGARRQVLLASHSRLLVSADISVVPSSQGEAPYSVIADEQGVLIRNSSLRDLIALAYGVQRWQVNGGPWLDSSRYDVRALAHLPVNDPEELQPYALRGLVAKLLASRFDLEIHVNQRCQAPCGRHALMASNAAY